MYGQFLTWWEIQWRLNLTRSFPTASKIITGCWRLSDLSILVCFRYSVTVERCSAGVRPTHTLLDQNEDIQPTCWYAKTSMLLGQTCWKEVGSTLVNVFWSRERLEDSDRMKSCWVQSLPLKVGIYKVCSWKHTEQTSEDLDKTPLILVNDWWRRSSPPSSSPNTLTCQRITTVSSIL